MFASATPPANFQAGILLGLVGFAFALAASPKGVRGGARHGFLFGLTANLLALRFVPEVIGRFTPLPAPLGWLALLLLACMQALPWAAGGAIARACSSRALVPAPLAFAIAVYVATFVPAVFPWTPAGGLALWPTLLQTAEVVGERGTSLLIAIPCALLADALARPHDWRRAGRRAALAVAILVSIVGYGALRLRAVDHARAASPHAKVALLAPDFDPVFHWEARRADAMLARLSAMTKSSEEEGAVLTIWPESSYPYTLDHGARLSPRGARAVLQPEVHGPVLTGAYMTKGSGLGTNSAILVQPGGAIEPSYDKRHLLWFGETVPLADVFPVLRRVFARGTGLEPGTESVRLVTGPIAAAVLNCYEDTLPVAGREAMAVRPNLLVNVTNDAWFTGSAEGELHLRLAVLRAIETRRDLLRAVNRGPTTWVDAGGRILARAGDQPARLVVDAALLDAPMTVYARAGDVPLIVLVIAVIAAFARRRRRVSA
jgi:apolipoprotein N-acyltransferase